MRGTLAACRLDCTHNFKGIGVQRLLELNGQCLYHVGMKKKAWLPRQKNEPCVSPAMLRIETDHHLSSLRIRCA